MKIASCSCGKDSLAMTYKGIENGLISKGDKIVFYSNGMDFQCIYNLWENLKKYAEPLGIICVELTPPLPFLYKMLEMPVNKGKPTEHKGYSWCGGNCRWGTTDKIKVIDKFYQNEEDFECLVGIAVDEQQRLKKERAPYKKFPLADWGMTEEDCLKYCRERGIKWLEWSDRIKDYVDLYDILDRVSCWCCKNKNLWELYNIWYYFPDTYWKQLLELQRKTDRPFRQPNKDGKYGFTLFELQEKFERGYVPKRRKKIIK